jgi:hypothetical protein
MRPFWIHSNNRASQSNKLLPALQKDKKSRFFLKSNHGLPMGSGRKPFQSYGNPASK